MTIEWPDRTWVTVSELARIAGVERRTVKREIDGGRLDALPEVPGIGPTIETAKAQQWLAGFTRYARQREPRKIST